LEWTRDINVVRGQQESSTPRSKPAFEELIEGIWGGPHPGPWLRDLSKPKTSTQHISDELLRVESSCGSDKSREKSKEDAPYSVDEEVEKPEDGVHTLDEECACEEC
jgi:hypothetical protein